VCQFSQPSEKSPQRLSKSKHCRDHLSDWIVDEKLNDLKLFDINMKYSSGVTYSKIKKCFKNFLENRKNEEDFLEKYKDLLADPNVDWLPDTFQYARCLEFDGGKQGRFKGPVRINNLEDTLKDKKRFEAEWEASDKSECALETIRTQFLIKAIPEKRIRRNRKPWYSLTKKISPKSNEALGEQAYKKRKRDMRNLFFSERTVQNDSSLILSQRLDQIQEDVIEENSESSVEAMMLQDLNL
jgi:hypothetical protein